MRFVRFHLSTALVVTLAAGGLLGLSLRYDPRIQEGNLQQGLVPESCRSETRKGIDGREYTVKFPIPGVVELTPYRMVDWEYGWPFRFAACRSWWNAESPHQAPRTYLSRKYDYKNMALDAAIAIAILIATAFNCEFVPARLTRFFKRRE